MQGGAGTKCEHKSKRSCVRPGAFHVFFFILNSLRNMIKAVDRALEWPETAEGLSAALPSRQEAKWRSLANDDGHFVRL